MYFFFPKKKKMKNPIKTVSFYKWNPLKKEEGRFRNVKKMMVTLKCWQLGASAEQHSWTRDSTPETIAVVRLLTATWRRPLDLFRLRARSLTRLNHRHHHHHHHLPLLFPNL